MCSSGAASCVGFGWQQIWMLHSYYRLRVLGFIILYLESALSLNWSGNGGRRYTMAAVKPVLRKPTFIKVDALHPATSGHTLIVKVVGSKLVVRKSRPDGQHVRHMRIAECLVGDETGVILLTARNEQVELMKQGATLILRNAKIDMFRGSMRLAVDKWGRVEVTGPATFAVNEDNNLSLVEYELVSVVDE